MSQINNVQNIPPTTRNAPAGNTGNAGDSQQFDQLLGELGNAKSNLLQTILTGQTPTENVTFSADLNSAIAPYSGMYNADNPAENMTSGNVEPQFSRQVTIYDSTGQLQQLSLDFLKTANNTWSVEISPTFEGETNSNVSEPLAAGTISFNSDGSVKSVSSSLTKSIAISWADGSKSDINFHWGDPGTTNVMSQPPGGQFFGLNSLVADGSPASTLSGVSVKSGQLTFSYADGATETLAQLLQASEQENNGRSCDAANSYGSGVALASQVGSHPNLDELLKS